MAKTARLTLLCLVAALLVPALSWGEDLLIYTPKPTETEQAPKSPDEGVLTRTVTVKRGDTLKKLSRKYLGRSSWFPQVLVFNEIKNPDLIHPGEKLKVPVPAGKSVSEQMGAPKKRHARAKRHHGHRAQATPLTQEVGKPAPVHEAVQPVPAPEAAKLAPAHEAAKPMPAHAAARPARKSETAGSSEEEESYLQAKLAYMRGDYRKSLALFNDFLQKYPNSSSAADAALYRADSLLHLSGK